MAFMEMLPTMIQMKFYVWNAFQLDWLLKNQKGLIVKNCSSLLLEKRMD